MRLLLLLLLLTGGVIKAQDNDGAANKSVDTIHSVVLKEDRYIWVRVPDGVDTVTTYPVLYLLDGEVLFDEANQLLNRLRQETGRPVAVIVVGIGNIWQRYRDYSPTPVASSPWLDPYSASISGGGEKFISFIETELFPHIHANYPASSKRILIGHSMGGLIAMQMLLKHPDLFDHYVAIDPSMWWDDEKLLNEAKAILANKAFEKKSLFLAVANTEDVAMDVAKIKKDTSEKTELIRPSLTLVDYINANPRNKLSFDWKFYQDYRHATVPGPAIYDALKLLLND